ncbi:MBL fold metallo-hydrolase [Tistrella arctica]|jgi:glyoxylase-like metal-dependent hydrolase (beta-lactamase superfamily II)
MDRAAGIVYPLDTRPEPGHSLEVAPGIYWVRMPLPFALNHINLWLVDEGEDGWAVVDTGINTRMTTDMWEQVFEATLQGRPVTRVVVTHFHPDHMGLAGWMVRRWPGARFHASLGEWLMARSVWYEVASGNHDARLAYYQKAGLTPDEIEGIHGRTSGYRKGVSELPQSFTRMSRDAPLRMAGDDWQVLIGRGHAVEHVSLYSPARRVLISGDQVLPRISPNIAVWPAEPDGDPLAMFLADMPQFLELPEDTLVLPSHDAPFHGLHFRVNALAAHHRDRLDAILTACGERPMTVRDTFPLLFGNRTLDAQQLVFATGEALAHINNLVHQGVIRREIGTDGIWRFVRR